MSKLFILLILTTHYAIISGENFNVQQINNDGIFFEKINEINFYTECFNIITKINIPDTDTITKSLIECYNHLKTLCAELTDGNPNDLCKPFMRELKWQTTQIQRQTNKLREMFGRRRGLINAGGKLSKFIFGTMDSDDEEEIYMKLNRLSDNQGKLLEIQNQQITLIKSNFEEVTRPILQLQTETEEIEKKLNQLIDKKNDLERKQNLIHQVAELSSLILVQYMHINEMQNEANEIITMLNINKLHPLITTQENITNILRENRKRYSTKIETHDIQRQIIKTDFIEIKGQIIVKITIPVIVEEEFVLFKPHIFPYLNQGTYEIYEIETEYIAVNLEKTKTIELNTEEIDKCQQIKNKLEEAFILCPHTQPILSTRNQHCITTLFMSLENKRDNCRTIPATPTNTIVKLKNTNSWLYSVHEVTKLTIKCDNQTENIQIINEGLLTFSKTCTVTSKDFTARVNGYPRKIELENQDIQITSREEKTETRPNSGVKPTKIEKLQLIDHRDRNRKFVQESNKINEQNQSIYKMKNKIAK